MNKSQIPKKPTIETVPVSLIVPCLNEATYIEDCLLSLLKGDYPADKLEILVLDGMSNDGTREILQKLQTGWPQIKLVDNPGASKPRALNTGIAMAKSEIVMRIDAHAIYAANYIKDLVKYLHVLEADNVGGIRLNQTRGTDLIARALAMVLTHPFGVGDAKHYTGVKEPAESDIIFLFCVRKSLFDEVGGFDERLIRGQDREFNLRMKSLGRKMMLCPDVTCTYFTREEIGSFSKWAYDSGVAPFEISRIIGTNLISFRNLIPPAFVATILLLPFLALWHSYAGLLLAGLIILYFSIGVLVSLSSIVKYKDPRFFVILPFCFFLWHFLYGLGGLQSLLKIIQPIGRA